MSTWLKLHGTRAGIKLNNYDSHVMLCYAMHSFKCNVTYIHTIAASERAIIFLKLNSQSAFFIVEQIRALLASSKEEEEEAILYLKRDKAKST